MKDKITRTKPFGLQQGYAETPQQKIFMADVSVVQAENHLVIVSFDPDGKQTVQVASHVDEATLKVRDILLNLQKKEA